MSPYICDRCRQRVHDAHKCERYEIKLPDGDGFGAWLYTADPETGAERVAEQYCQDACEYPDSVEIVLRREGTEEELVFEVELEQIIQYTARAKETETEPCPA